MDKHFFQRGNWIYTSYMCLHPSVSKRGTRDRDRFYVLITEQKNDK